MLIPVNSDTSAGRSMFFVPQRTYLCEGSLRAQIKYPEEDTQGVTSTENRELEALLTLVGLGQLFDRHGLEEVQVP